MNCIRKEAKRFFKEIGRNLTIHSVKQYLKKLGYDTVVYELGSKIVSEFFERLDIDDEIEGRLSFTLKFQRRKSIFVLDTEYNFNIYCLLREVAHIVLEHQPLDPTAKIQNFSGNDNSEASDFASYLCELEKRKISNILKKVRRFLLSPGHSPISYKDSYLIR